MLVINNEYRFSFEIPDEYREIEREDYEQYHVDPSTLHIFIKLVRDMPKTISLNRDDTVADEEDYLSLVKLNTDNMAKMDMHVFEQKTIPNERYRVDVVYSSFKTLKFVTYFTVVQNLMIACSTEITYPEDKSDKEVAALFESIKEF